ncbi:hypothetical protein AArcSl_1346 [Halalkaliarchaeum desulfuricum]|uniref:Uncharacterized protein n=2 Tax=Halalkaliarchaeum desulfuricum TaxID=2055893 RepID=A0A343TIQ5_9EURY|nr:hypothetical protein AArcSl_1346 [Halalkaliarchaeum desulfuricum]
MVSLAVALLLLVGAAGTAIAIAHGSLAAAEREPAERNVATDLADRLVSSDAPHVRRENVLDRNEIEALSVTDVESLAPGIEDRPFRIRIDDRTLLERGEPTGGTRVERLVVLAADDERTYRLDLEEDEAVTVPRRTDELQVTVEPENDTSVSTIRVNDRVLLYDPGGLEGTATASVPWTATLRVTVQAEGSDGTVAITATPETTAKAHLEVTVGAER